MVDTELSCMTRITLSTPPALRYIQLAGRVRETKIDHIRMVGIDGPTPAAGTEAGIPVLEVLQTPSSATAGRSLGRLGYRTSSPGGYSTGSPTADTCPAGCVGDRRMRSELPWRSVGGRI